jgi:large subunit ribosomal protein L17
MRHRVKGRKLSRTASHRHALLKSLATSLLKHKQITTTTAKAKELRKFVEPIISKARIDSVATRRYVAEKINDREVVQNLFNDIVTKIGDRPGGYTRIVHRGQRKGDGADLAIIELVDFSGVIKAKASKKEKGANKVPEVKEEAKTEEKKEAKTKKKNVVKAAREKSPKEKVKNKEKAVKTTKTPQKKGG